MSERVGLVTGSAAFAGLPTNPAALVLPEIEGMIAHGIRVVTRETPVSYRALPSLLPELIGETSPAFVLSIGLALGAPVVQVESMSVNAAHFAVADNDGALPRGGARFDADGPQGRAATWDAARIVERLKDGNVPAIQSFHAGTHLCNLTLYTMLGALEAAGSRAPCGFLHLPYLPEQVVWMMRNRPAGGDHAPITPVTLPSMAFELQVAAVRTVVDALAQQAAERSGQNEIRQQEVPAR